MCSNKTGGHVDAHDVHLVGLNAEFLATYLQEAGFERMERGTQFPCLTSTKYKTTNTDAEGAAVERHGLFSDTSDMTVAGALISLNVNAFKAARTVAVPAEPLAGVCQSRPGD